MKNTIKTKIDHPNSSASFQIFNYLQETSLLISTLLQSPDIEAPQLAKICNSELKKAALILNKITHYLEEVKSQATEKNIQTLAQMRLSLLLKRLKLNPDFEKQTDAEDMLSLAFSSLQHGILKLNQIQDISFFRSSLQKALYSRMQDNLQQITQPPESADRLHQGLILHENTLWAAYLKKHLSDQQINLQALESIELAQKVEESDIPNLIWVSESLATQASFDTLLNQWKAILGNHICVCLLKGSGQSVPMHFNTEDSLNYPLKSELLIQRCKTLKELSLAQEIKSNKILKRDFDSQCKDFLTQIQDHVKDEYTTEKQAIILDLLAGRLKRLEHFMHNAEIILIHQDALELVAKKQLKAAIQHFLAFFEAFMTWFSTDICHLSEEAILEGRLNQLILKFCKPYYKTLHNELKGLKTSFEANSIHINLEELDHLINEVRDAESLDKNQLLEHVVSMGQDLDKSTTSLEAINQILVEAMTLSHAQSGTVYLLENEELKFLAIINHAMNLNQQDPKKIAKQFPPIKLYDPKTKKANLRYVCVYAAIQNQLLNIEDIDAFREQVAKEVEDEDDDGVGSEVYQKKTGYEARTFLCLPIRKASGAVVGVLQLSNRIEEDEVVPFPKTLEDPISTLASMAPKHLKSLGSSESIVKVIQKKLSASFKWKNTFPFYKQPDQMDCGPTCLKMISKYYGKSFSLQFLREKSYITNQGVSMLSLSQAAEAIGFRTLAFLLSYEELKNEVACPVILCWGSEHFIIIHKIEKQKIHIADPAFGLLQLSEDQFLKDWKLKNPSGDVAALTLEPTPFFYHPDQAFEKKDKSLGLSFFMNYLRPYKSYVLQLGLGFLCLTLLSLVPPFLTQSLVDFGIENKNMQFIYLLLVAQIMMFFGEMAISFISSWITLFLGAKLNISMLTDFFSKLMKLKMPFFEVKTRGDILQRVADHDNIEEMLSNSTINSIFSLFSIVIFAGILLYYSPAIFVVFFAGSIMSVGWISLFLDKQKQLNYKAFEQESKSQSMMIEMLDGINEVKLNSIEKETRWRWEYIQAKKFKLNINWLKLNQIQELGNMFINQLKNILILFLSAKLVIEGHITLGMMMSMQYIIGQLNAPIANLIDLIGITQSSAISVQRLSTVHLADDEESKASTVNHMPEDLGFNLKKVSFYYEGPNSDPVLDQLSIKIPGGKMTAIVGASGSGKSTLLKVLLKFYEPTKGNIDLGNTNLSEIPHSLYRSRCGVVLQDGFMFADTIRKNITLKDEKVDEALFQEAVRIACVEDFIDDIPQGYDTPVGSGGVGLSKGQKQRIFIARAVYKNPDIIFFDEATSALDASTEKKLTDNLREFCKGKTIFVIAHRLSTVKDADQIAVLVKGKIIELGDHSSLVEKKGFYFNLVKDQLQLGD